MADDMFAGMKKKKKKAPKKEVKEEVEEAPTQVPEEASAPVEDAPVVEAVDDSFEDFSSLKKKKV